MRPVSVPPVFQAIQDRDDPIENVALGENIGGARVQVERVATDDSAARGRHDLRCADRSAFGESDRTRRPHHVGQNVVRGSPSR